MDATGQSETYIEKNDETKIEFYSLGYSILEFDQITTDSAVPQLYSIIIYFVG